MEVCASALALASRLEDVAATLRTICADPSCPLGALVDHAKCGERACVDFITTWELDRRLLKSATAEIETVDQTPRQVQTLKVGVKI
jgi:hypothetical protein